MHNGTTCASGASACHMGPTHIPHVGDAPCIHVVPPMGMLVMHAMCPMCDQYWHGTVTICYNFVLYISYSTGMMGHGWLVLQPVHPGIPEQRNNGVYIMLNGKTIHKVATKLTKDAPEKSTTITLDWSGVGDELVKSIATRQVIVTLQGKFRRDELIPASFEYRVADYGSKVAEPVTVETTLARGLALDEAGQKALIAQLQANLAKAAPVGQPIKK